MTEQATDQAAIACDAELAATRAVQRLALDHYAAETADEPLRSGAAGMRVTAAAGLQAARHLERAARNQVHAYIRAARRDGMDWHEVGVHLGLGPDAAEGGLTVAESAFSFAARQRVADPWDEVTFWWTCRACERAITDRGPTHRHPEDAEPGHAEDCARLAAAVAEHDATWTQDS